MLGSIPPGLVRQGIVSTGAAVLFFATRSVLSRNRPLHPLVVSTCPDLPSWNAPLGTALSELALHLPEDAMTRVMHHVESIRRHVLSNSRTAAWHMHGHVSAIVQCVRAHGVSNPTVEDIRNNILLCEDVFPAVLKQLDDVIHNHLLDAML